MIDRPVPLPRYAERALIEYPPLAESPDDPRVGEMRRHVAARLARVCQDLSDAQFARLVARVAAFRLRWSLPLDGSADRGRAVGRPTAARRRAGFGA
jgi:hypothetical protein